MPCCFSVASLLEYSVQFSLTANDTQRRRELLLNVVRDDKDEDDDCYGQLSAEKSGLDLYCCSSRYYSRTSCLNQPVQLGSSLNLRGQFTSVERVH